ncbi:MAG: 3-beta hydroxysteroid dehydrogenase [Nitrospira sp.]
MDRGHEVSAIVRHPEKLKPHPKLRPCQGDVYDEDDLARPVSGQDAVISAFNPGWTNPDIYNQQVRGTKAIINGVKKVGVARPPFLSPSADLVPGTRTGTFRLGTDQLLRDANGASRISVEDYAVAMVDELERPAHIRKRFTVGY